MLLLDLITLLLLQAPDVLVNDLTLNTLAEMRPATQQQVRHTTQRSAAQPHNFTAGRRG
jgi:hypothetical protein